MNDSRKCEMSRKVLHALTEGEGGAAPKGKTVALLGLTFMPNIHDMRDAPAITQALTDEDVTVRAYDQRG